MKTLLNISSPALGGAEPDPGSPLFRGDRGVELLDLLGQRNGFYAFESALHVLPSDALEQWNAAGSWRDDYDLAEDVVFFAEDLFGCQFCIADGEVFSFDPETAEMEPIAATIRGWARALLEDYEALTGQPLGHAWQIAHGPLEPGFRLAPKIPFVLGGEFTVDNLAPIPAEASMRFRADIARQIADLPEGTIVELVVEE